jgi:hypothetical protein
MPRLWEKLNLGEHGEVLVLNAPRSFAAELKALQGVRVQQRDTAVKEVAFALVFVLNQAELDRWSAAVAAKAAGDALLWFAYPYVRHQPRQRLACLAGSGVRLRSPGGDR